jgi:peptidoglycan/LPS O-acetylase OafA/YrhL
VVVCYAYEQRLKAGMSFLQFVNVRLIRIYPLYFLGCCIGLINFVEDYNDLGTAHTGAVILFTVFLMPALFSSNLLFPLNQVAWSLHLELFVNLFYAWNLKRLNRKPLLGILSVSFLVVIVTLFIHHHIDYGWLRSSYFPAYFRTAYSFFMGVLLYRHYHATPRNAQISSNMYAWTLLGAVALLLMANPSQNYRPFYDFFMVTLILPAIIYCALWIQPQNISKNVFIFLGSISYAIYAVHAPMGSLIAHVLKGRGVNVAAYSPQSGYLFLLFLVLFAWLTDKIYDTPIRNFFGRYLPKRARPQHQVA